MSTNTKEINVGKPSAFDGDRAKSRQFIFACLGYFEVNKHIYQNDESKILFILNLMTAGTAEHWKNQWLAAHTTLSDTFVTTCTYGSTANFLKEFFAAFSHISSKKTAARELVKLQWKNGADYVHHFHLYASESGATDSPLLQVLFEEKLPRTILSVIDGRKEEMTSMEDYYTLVLTQDARYQHRSGTRGPGVYVPRQTTKPARDPNAMDIDAATIAATEQKRYLTDEEAARRKREGLCFWSTCGRKGCSIHNHQPGGSQYRPRTTVAATEVTPQDSVSQTSTNEGTITAINAMRPQSTITDIIDRMTAKEQKELAEHMYTKGF